MREYPVEIDGVTATKRYRSGGRPYVSVVCKKCGKEFEAGEYNFLAGTVKNCPDCRTRKGNPYLKRHGMSKTHLHDMWIRMRASGQPYTLGEFEEFRDWAYKTGYEYGKCPFKKEFEKGYTADNIEWIPCKDVRDLRRKTVKEKAIREANKEYPRVVNGVTALRRYRIDTSNRPRVSVVCKICGKEFEAREDNFLAGTVKNCPECREPHRNHSAHTEKKYI